MSLFGKIAIITGASNGIGAACAKKFAAAGARIVITDIDLSRGEIVTNEINAPYSTKTSDSSINHNELLESQHSENENHDIRAIFVKCDVRRQSDIEAVLFKAEQVFGGIDILVNNAGIQNVKSLMETSIEEWDDLIKVNLTSVFLTTKLVVPYMEKRGGGTIINVSSSFAIVGSYGYAAYHASKGGVSSLTRATAISLIEKNIRVNAICPGTIFTPGLIKGVEETCGDKQPSELIQSFLDKQPLKRFGKAEEIANVIAFIASSEASFVVGADIVADGGYTIV